METDRTVERERQTEKETLRGRGRETQFPGRWGKLGLQVSRTSWGSWGDCVLCTQESSSWSGFLVLSSQLSSEGMSCSEGMLKGAGWTYRDSWPSVAVYSHQRFTPRAGATGHLVAQGRFSPWLPMGAWHRPAARADWTEGKEWPPAPPGVQQSGACTPQRLARPWGPGCWCGPLRLSQEWEEQSVHFLSKPHPLWHVHAQVDINTFQSTGERTPLKQREFSNWSQSLQNFPHFPTKWGNVLHLRNLGWF